MSISREILDKGSRTKKFLTSKAFQSVFAAFSVFFLFLGVFNAYAADDELKVGFDWKGSNDALNVLNGTEKGEDNVVTTNGTTDGAVAVNALYTIAPQTSPNYDKLVSDPDIPQSMKLGLVGVADNAGDYAYANYPMVDLGDHLAQNWVPGYKDSVTGIYAAESGYDTLANSGIMPLWTKTLNLSYVFFVVIMIVAGFMIMFRHKLGGQTMVTIGNVLPNVIMALIIATFSFAIAGLIIDIGGMLVIIIADFLGGENVGIGSIWQILGSALLNTNVGVTTLSSGILGGGIVGITSLVTQGGLVAALTGGLGIGLIAGTGILGIVIALVIIGIILVGAFKVLIALYKAYFSLLLNVILGPIQITLGALPGNKQMIGNWLKSVLRNVLVFPVIFFIVNLPNAIAGEDGGMNLNFPDKLVNTDAGMQNLDATSGIFIFILRILVLYFAAQAPKFLEAWFPPNDNKAMAEGIGQAKASLSKIPLLGGLFK